MAGLAAVTRDDRSSGLDAGDLVALDAKTGKLRWYYQFTPHDLHDWDSNHVPVLLVADELLISELRTTLTPDQTLRVLLADGTLRYEAHFLKNLLVREVIHPASGRKGAYVPFDCATVPETLLQSALFGAVRRSSSATRCSLSRIFATPVPTSARTWSSGLPVAARRSTHPRCWR